MAEPASTAVTAVLSIEWSEVYRTLLAEPKRYDRTCGIQKAIVHVCRRLCSLIVEGPDARRDLYLVYSDLIALRAGSHKGRGVT
jgi:hypothetical protein